MSVQFAREYDEIAGLAKEWETLRQSSKASVLNSHSILCACLRHLPPNADIHFLVDDKCGEVRAILPMAIFRYRASGLAIRALSLIGNGKGMLGLYHSAPMVNDSSMPINNDLMVAIKKLPWNTVHLAYLEPTPYVSGMLDSISRMSHFEPVTESPCVYIDLATTDGVRMIEGKFGRKLNRMWGELEANGRLLGRTVSNPDDAERSIGIYIDQHKCRWKNRGLSVFENENIASFLVDLARTVTKEGKGWINEVLIDGEVAGQQMIISEGGTAYAYRIGINESLREFSPGHMVTAFTIDSLKAKGFKILDLGPGDERYKKKQGGTNQTLLNANAKRGGLNVLAGISNLPLVNGIVGKLGIRNKLIKDIDRW